MSRVRRILVYWGSVLVVVPMAYNLDFGWAGWTSLVVGLVLLGLACENMPDDD